MHSMVLVGDKMSLQQSTQTSFDYNEHLVPLLNTSQGETSGILYYNMLNYNFMYMI